MAENLKTSIVILMEAVRAMAERDGADPREVIEFAEKRLHGLRCRLERERAGSAA